MGMILLANSLQADRASFANGVWRVLAKGFSASQSNTRTRLIARAMKICWRCAPIDARGRKRRACPLPLAPSIHLVRLGAPEPHAPYVLPVDENRLHAADSGRTNPAQ